ncbi:MAG: RNA methyltransferase [Bacteroidales bacterium]|nr:RNA methyltransferase [Bacteroidales bacterium]
MIESLIQYLETFVTDRRASLFDRILQHRTRYITVALEDIFQSQNASAVLRTCDCLGIQDVHIIENRNIYDVNPDVALGSDKWLNLVKYNSEGNNSLEAIQKLRKEGYRIVATTPHEPSTPLPDFDLSKGKVALFFGTELKGLTSSILDNADENLQIPLYGFTESFNISVSAAIILHDLTEKLWSSNLPKQLSKEEINELKLKWLRQTIKKSEMIEKKFRATHSMNLKNKPKG